MSNFKDTVYSILLNEKRQSETITANGDDPQPVDHETDVDSHPGVTLRTEIDPKTGKTGYRIVHANGRSAEEQAAHLEANKDKKVAIPGAVGNVGALEQTDANGDTMMTSDEDGLPIPILRTGEDLTGVSPEQLKTNYSADPEYLKYSAFIKKIFSDNSILKSPIPSPEMSLKPSWVAEREQQQEKDKAKKDLEDAEKAVKTRASLVAAATKEIKDAKVETSSGVKRSLTAAEAQKAAKDVDIESPFGNARPGEGLLTPEEQARINQVQQNPGDTTSRSAFKVKEQIDSNKIFNRTTGQWEQGGPPRSKGAPRPTGFNPYQHIDGMREYEGPPPDSRTPERIKVEDEEMRSRSRELLNDIIIKNAKQKEFDLNSTPNDRQKLDNEQRAKNGLPPRSQSDFDTLDKDRERRKTEANKKEEERNTPEAIANRKAKNAEAAADRRAKREAHNEKMQSATFEIGPNGVQRMVRPGSGGSGSGGGGGGGGGYGGSGVGPFGSGSGGNVSSRNPTAQDSFASTATSATPATSSIVSARTDGRAGQASALAVFNASKNKRPSNSRSRTMQTAGYSYNKALTFFAEQLKRKYIEEEVVNPENQPMSKSEISHRNKIRGKSPAKDARAIKGSDTKENAEYRLATYITMRRRKGKKKENK